MIDLDPLDRISRPEERRFPVVFGIFVVIAALGCGWAYWYYASTKASYAGVYAELGIAPLPIAAELQPQVRNRLEQLGREPCYRAAISGLSQALLAAGYPRESATTVLGFVQRCPGSDDLLAFAYGSLIQVGDFAQALRIADQLVKAFPARSDFHYLRARASDRLNDFAGALSDYANTVQLAGNPKNLVVDVFYNMSRMYAEMGRYCDAITPIETYISFDPAKRRTLQTTRIITDYAQKGACETHYSHGLAHVSFLGSTGVHILPVTVNGVPGKFVLDTGATYVSVTSEFAAKAKVNIEPGNQLTMQTASGTVPAVVGYANSVTLDRAEAQGVALAVMQGRSDPFGNRMDGLLGMSFLARFKMDLSQDGLTLTSIPLADFATSTGIK